MLVSKQKKNKKLQTFQHMTLGWKYRACLIYTQSVIASIWSSDLQPRCSGVFNSGSFHLDAKDSILESSCNVMISDDRTTTERNWIVCNCIILYHLVCLISYLSICNTRPCPNLSCLFGTFGPPSRNSLGIPNSTSRNPGPADSPRFQIGMPPMGCHPAMGLLQETLLIGSLKL